MGSKRHRRKRHDRTARPDRVREHAPSPVTAAPVPVPIATSFAPPPPPPKEETIRGRIAEITRTPTGGAHVQLDDGQSLALPRSLVDDSMRRGRWLRATKRGGAVLAAHVVGW